MKNIIIIALILFSSFQSFAQDDTTRVEQYAEVVSTPRLLSNKVTIDIDYGEEVTYCIPPVSDDEIKSFLTDLVTKDL